jgi:hypothetical protein
VFRALKHPLDEKQVSTTDAILLEDGVGWRIWQEALDNAKPSPAPAPSKDDKIVDENNVTWTVLSVKRNLRDVVHECVCRADV